MTPSSLFRRATLILVLSMVTIASMFASSPHAQAATAFAGTATKPTADGYWTTSTDGVVIPHDNAAFLGDLRSDHLNQPIVGIASTPTGLGYWLVARDGGIFAFGDAAFYGSTGSIALNQPVVGIASTPTGHGYWMVARDGGLFAFGDAAFYGSTGSIALNQPIVGMASSVSGRGYWMVASDGGVFAFGDAAFYGSTGSIALNQPIVGMAATPTGRGYWMVASDGGVFAFGDAPFQGAATGGGGVFGMTVDSSGAYNLLRTDGSVQRRPRAAVPSAPVLSNPVVPSIPPTTPSATVPTTTPQTTTSPPPTTVVTAPPAVSNTNPFSARALYVDPYNPARTQADAWRSSRPADATYMDRMGNANSAVWIGEWSGDVESATRTTTSAAVSTNAMPVLVAYNIPGRDCGQWSSGGAASAAAYQSWIRHFAAGIGNRPAAVILEPDALAGMDCLDSAGQQNRLHLLADAVDVLSSNPNTAVYLDAGNANWQSVATMKARLQLANISKARGFSLNVSNYYSTSQSLAYGDQLVAALGGSHYVIDTSRNGNGANGEWCNPSGRALGQLPTANTGNSNVDAYLWLKRPGESDGQCNGGPSAGTWWPDYALGLAKAAWG